MGEAARRIGADDALHWPAMEIEWGCGNGVLFMTSRSPDSARSVDPEKRYRLYIDESGDHVLKFLDQPAHRFLCLIGCVFQERDYRVFHRELEDFKQRHIPHSPDEPIVLHREDIINRRRGFWRLRDPAVAEVFDADLLEVVTRASFVLIAVVIDKLMLRERYPTPAHPYHLALGFLLQRYCGRLNHLNRRGDVLAESRGGREDRLLKDSYSRVYQRGAWMNGASFFQQGLTTHELKLKPKSANIAGLQLADLTGHPIRQSMLIEKGMVSGPLGFFAARLIERIDCKFNRHLYDGRVWGYGKVWFPT